MSLVGWTPPPEQILDETVVSDARLTNYLAASAITVLIADYFGTVNEEINFVWNRRWSIPSILYLWNRYITLITVFSCATFMFKEIKTDNAQGIVSTLLVVSFDLMLVLRVWVLYGKTRRMSYILFSMLLAELISMHVILLRPATKQSDFVHLGPVLPGCYFTVFAMSGPYFAFYAVPPLLVTFTMFILTVYKCSKALHAGKSAELPIITLFLRDGIIWFIVVFGIDGEQMLIWATGRATLMQVLIIPCLVLYSLVASRVLLNVRSLPGSDGFDDGQESEWLLPGAVRESRWYS